MKCHYEVLEVPRDVSADDLKKAYRKLAIRWHPDKNLENIEEATEQFKLVQQAFEVLNDPHERAWYDDHRDAILKGKVGAQCDDESLDVYQYFTPSCYRGFGDDEKGFYSVYREVFNKIAAEDSEYQTASDSDFEIPSFGKSDSPYDEVRSFYNYWQSYCTKKSYSWLDPYDIRQAPNGRVVRLMEKDNKKVRDKARKARNEEVRELVKFVNKRDKRVIAYAQYLQELSAENAKKSEEKRREKIKERQLELAAQKESEWSKFSNLEDELKGIEANIASEFGDSVSASENSDLDDDNNEEEISNNNMYCVACNKLFKNSKAFENHESSKKHKDNVQILKQQMAESDDENLDIDLSDNESNYDDEISDGKNEENEDTDEVILNEEDGEEDFTDSNKLTDNCVESKLTYGEGEGTNRESLFCKVCEKGFKTRNAKKKHLASQSHIKNSKLYKKIINNFGSDTEIDGDVSDRSSVTSSVSDLDSILENVTNGDSDLKDNLDRVMSKFDELERKEDKELHDDIEKICHEIDNIIEKEEKREEKIGLSKTRKNKNKIIQSVDLQISDDDFDFSLGQSKKQKKRKQNLQQASSKNKDKCNKIKELDSLTDDKFKTTELGEDRTQTSNELKGNPELKLEKLPLNKKESSGSNKIPKKKEDKNPSISSTSDSNTICAVCQSTFPSKNKLFQHLTKTGHSVYLPEQSAKNSQDDKNSRKKGKNKRSKK